MFGRGKKPKNKNKIKVKKDKVKNVKKYSNTKKIMFLMIILIAVVIGINYYSSMELRDEVDIVVLNNNVPQEGLITEEMITKETMVRAEFEKRGITEFSDGTKRRSIILWEDRSKLINTYASYYIRAKTPIYWDVVSVESPKQFSYLYKMDGELMKLDINAGEFGEMLVPGDRINIRASYEERVYTLPSESEFRMQQQTGIQPQTTVQENIKLFNSVAVLDILNSSNESIFEIYYKMLALPRNQQEELVATEEFKSKVSPSKILLNVTPEEVDRYAMIQSKGPKYTLTLLPRTSSNAITEMLNELSTGFARE